MKTLREPLSTRLRKRWEAWLDRNKTHLVPCHDDDWAGPAPVPLRVLGIERIVGRTILEWDHNLGTYGSGGCGYNGFRLSPTEAYPEEWLVLLLWSAEFWLLLDGRWVSAPPQMHDQQRPWYGWGLPAQARWDEFTLVVVGSCIASAEISDSESLIVLERDGTKQRHLLELPRDTTRLSKYLGTGRHRRWNPAKESHWDAWAISRKGKLYR